MFLLVNHNFCRMLLATGTVPQLQPETPVVFMQEQTLPVRDSCCP